MKVLYKKSKTIGFFSSLLSYDRITEENENFKMRCIKCYRGRKLPWSRMVVMWEGFALILSKWLGFQQDDYLPNLLLGSRFFQHLSFCQVVNIKTD